MIFDGLSSLVCMEFNRGPIRSLKITYVNFTSGVSDLKTGHPTFSRESFSSNENLIDPTKEGVYYIFT